MSRRFGNERGGILVISAVAIPVFLIVCALVIDVGNWFTHKRQLQNRADAAAFAAGVEYAENWEACAQNADATLKTTTAREIANTARQYAADPEAADYAPDPLPSALFNSEIANQANLDVVINSTGYNDDTDYTDGAAGQVANPCYMHAGDDISPAGGLWTDVKVKERDLPSLFGVFGLPLSQNGARARVEIRPSIAQDGLLPLAVPNNIIVKAQVRYYDECRNTLVATRDLAPLPAADQAAHSTAGGGTLWGLPSAGNPAVGDSSRSFSLTLPAYDGTCNPYLPLGVEVRIASRDEIDLNASCATLAASKFADCFRRISQVRIYDNGSPTPQPRAYAVTATGGCSGPSGDAYFGPLPLGATDCRFGATVQVDWGPRDDGNRNVPANFRVIVNGVDLVPPAGSPTGTWTTSGTPLIAAAGATNLNVKLEWQDRDPTHSAPGGGACRNRPPNQNPCSYIGPNEAAHRVWVGTTANAGAVELVRTSQSPFGMGSPGVPFEYVAAGGGSVQIFPTIGIKSVLRPGQFVTLRLDDPQANQTLRCDPDYAQGQEFSAFRFGCKPWYGENTFTDPTWWNAGTQTCPTRDTFFFYGTNGSSNPWRCVPTAPGLSPPVIGEGFSVATENCSRINNNSCQQTVCNVIEGQANYEAWRAGTDPGAQGSLDPRVVNLFVIPYQSLKGATGGDPRETVPTIGFAAFYVMAWGGNNSNQDPCPDLTFGNVNIPQPPPGSVVGVFINPVFIGGPVDPNANCVVGQLQPCRAVLTR